MLAPTHTILAAKRLIQALKATVKLAEVAVVHYLHVTLDTIIPIAFVACPPSI